MAASGKKPFPPGPNASQLMAERFNESMRNIALSSGYGQNVNFVESTPRSFKVFDNWAETASDELGIPKHMLFNKPNQYSSDLDVFLGGEGMSAGWLRPRGDNWNAALGLNKEGIALQTGGNYTYEGMPDFSEDEVFFPERYTVKLPKSNVLGHELYHSLDVNFKDNSQYLYDEDGNFLGDNDYFSWDPTQENPYPHARTEGGLTRFDTGLDNDLNAFGGPLGDKEFVALQRSWDRVPNQWTIENKRGGFAGQNNDVYVKDNQMRDALTDFYMNSENMQMINPESRPAIAKALATSMSSPDYDKYMNEQAGEDLESLEYKYDNLYEDGRENSYGYPQGYRTIFDLLKRESTDPFAHNRVRFNSLHANPHEPLTIDSDYAKEKMANAGNVHDHTHMNYLNEPTERAARFFGPAFGDYFENTSETGFSLKDQKEQYPELKPALGKWLMQKDGYNYQ